MEKVNLLFINPLLAFKSLFRCASSLSKIPANFLFNLFNLHFLRVLLFGERKRKVSARNSNQKCHSCQRLKKFSIFVWKVDKLIISINLRCQICVAITMSTSQTWQTEEKNEKFTQSNVRRKRIEKWLFLTDSMVKEVGILFEI